MNKKFYFTFGTSLQFPYQNGYVTVDAENLKQAIEKFREHFPDRHNVVDCSSYYTEEEWITTTMYNNTDYPLYESL